MTKRSFEDFEAAAFPEGSAVFEKLRFFLYSASEVRALFVPRELLAT
jgi:hypothetical protein